MAESRFIAYGPSEDLMVENQKLKRKVTRLKQDRKDLRQRLEASELALAQAESNMHAADLIREDTLNTQRIPKPRRRRRRKRRGVPNRSPSSASSEDETASSSPPVKAPSDVPTPETALASLVSSLQAAVGDMKTRFEELQTRHEELQTRHEELQTRHEGLKTRYEQDIEELKTRHEQDIEDLNERMSRLESLTLKRSNLVFVVEVLRRAEYQFSLMLDDSEFRLDQLPQSDLLPPRTPRWWKKAISLWDTLRLERNKIAHSLVLVNKDTLVEESITWKDWQEVCPEWRELPRLLDVELSDEVRLESVPV